MDFLRGKVTPQDWRNVGYMLGFTAVLVMAFIFLVQGFQRSTLERIRTEDAAVKNLVEDALRKQANLKELETKAEKIQRLVTEFDSRLPSARELPRLVREFEAMAADVGLVSVGVNPLPPERDGRKETTPYNVTATGSFHQIVAFINQLERYKRYLKVSDLDIGPEKMGIAEAKFKLSTYRFLEPASGAAS